MSVHALQLGKALQLQLLQLLTEQLFLAANNDSMIRTINAYNVMTSSFALLFLFLLHKTASILELI